VKRNGRSLFRRLLEGRQDFHEIFLCRMAVSNFEARNSEELLTAVARLTEHKVTNKLITRGIESVSVFLCNRSL
jgi:hypothetical protein